MEPYKWISRTPPEHPDSIERLLWQMKIITGEVPSPYPILSNTEMVALMAGPPYHCNLTAYVKVADEVEPDQPIIIDPKG